MDDQAMRELMQNKLEGLRDKSSSTTEITIAVPDEFLSRWSMVAAMYSANGISAGDIEMLRSLCWCMGVTKACQTIEEVESMSPEYQEKLVKVKSGDKEMLEEVANDIRYRVCPDGKFTHSITIPCDEDTKEAFDGIIQVSSKALTDPVDIELLKGAILRQGIMAFFHQTEA